MNVHYDDMKTVYEKHIDVSSYNKVYFAEFH